MVDRRVSVELVMTSAVARGLYLCLVVPGGRDGAAKCRARHPGCSVLGDGDGLFKRSRGLGQRMSSGGGSSITSSSVAAQRKVRGNEAENVLIGYLRHYRAAC